MRSLEELKELSKLALEYEELIEIARTALSNTGAKNQALEFTKEQGLGEQVAMACRWLRMFRVQVSEKDFESFTLQQEEEMTTEGASISKNQVLKEFIRLAHTQDEATKKSCQMLSNTNLDLDRIESITGFKFSIPLLEGFSLAFKSERIEGLTIRIGIHPLNMGRGLAWNSFHLQATVTDGDGHSEWSAWYLFGCGGEMTRVRYSDLLTAAEESAQRAFDGFCVSFEVVSAIGNVYEIQLSKKCLSVYMRGKDYTFTKFTPAHFSIDRLAPL